MMIQRWAMLQNGTVINVCLWDGSLDTWQPPEGIEMKLAEDHIGIGWNWDGTSWIEPTINQE